MAKRKSTTRRVQPVIGSPRRRKSASKRKRRSPNKGFTLNPFKLLFRGLGKLPRLAYWTLIFGLWGGIASLGIIGFYAAQLPQATSWQVPKRPPNVKIVSRHGKLLANRGVTGGEAVSLAHMSPYIPQAVIAIEDRRFRWHFGIDPIGFTRAMIVNVMAGRLVQGGSTLSQQLAKNMFLKPERTFRRKVQELVLAFWLEAKFSKDEILEMYLNRVYFGSGSYGIAAASRRYFSKPARDINLAEAAMLAGVLKAPSRLSPKRNPDLAEARAQLVLAAMRRQNYITDREATKALSMQADSARNYWSGAEHYVADQVMKELTGLLGKITRDLVVDTTIESDLQRAAEAVLRNRLDKHGKKRNVSQGAIISLSGSGAIRAMVGGRDYAKSQFNRAQDAKRQPGSAFKPFVFLASLEQGNSPVSMRHDGPIRIGNWQPENYNRKYQGPVSLQQSMEQSINTVAAQLAMEVGPRRVAKTAKRLGIDSKLQANASIALGTSEVSLKELTLAYVPFANGGYRARAHVIRRVRTKSGKILYERRTPRAVRVIADRELVMMHRMLRGVVTSGTGRRAELAKFSVAGKTGTSQNFRDSWFIGYTSQLITGVWLGNDDGTPTRKVTGSTLPAEIWASYMVTGKAGQSPSARVGVAQLPVVLPENVPVPRRRPGSAPARFNKFAAISDRERKSSSTRKIVRPRIAVVKKPKRNSGTFSKKLTKARSARQVSRPAHPVPPANIGRSTGSTSRSAQKTLLDRLFDKM